MSDPASPDPGSAASPDPGPPAGRLVLNLPSDIAAIEGAVDHAVEHCGPAGLDRRRLLFNFRVGLTEALSNAVLYGNAGDPDKRVRVELRAVPGEVRVRVSDEGDGFDPGSVPDPRLPENLVLPDGRGVFVMRALMDEVRFNRRGNAVTLTLRGSDANAPEGRVPQGPVPETSADLRNRLADLRARLALEAERSASLADEVERGRKALAAALEANRTIREDLARERLSREMELAHDLQMKLLPPIPRVPRVEAAAQVVPATSVGGDFYQVIQLSGGRVGVMIGDVSGHGFPAALIMALVMSAAAIYAEQGAAPATVLEYVDRAIGDELESTEMYLSLCYCVLSPGEPEVAYSNAGHPHAFVIGSSGAARRLLATDPPMGIGTPPYSQAVAEWRPAEDILLLFTDGLSDTLAHTGRNSGEDVVLRTVEDLRRRPAEEILRALFELSRRATPSIPSDDRTAVVLRTR